MIPLNLEIVTRLPLGQPGAVGDLEPAASGAEDLVAGKKLAGRCPAAIFDRTRLYLFRVPMAAGPPQKRNGDLGKRSSTAVQITNSDFLTDASLNRFFDPKNIDLRLKNGSVFNLTLPINHQAWSAPRSCIRSCLGRVYPS
jgi:hypothetical protein